MGLDMLKQIIIDTIKEEEHLGDNLKKQCVDYINELESQQANNCFFQGGRGSGKTYITKLEQQLNLYKEVVEEVKKNLKLERKIALSLNQPYTISIVDRTLHILDKAKGEMNNGE